MLKNTDTITNASLREKILNSSEMLLRNISLIKLNSSLPHESWKSQKIISKQTPKWDIIANIAEKIELKSFLNDLEKFKSASPIIVNNIHCSQEQKQTENEKNPSLFTPDMFDA